MIGIIALVAIMLIWLLARERLRLIQPTTSSIRFAGEEITALDRQLRNTRRAMQMVNLEPLRLHPKMTPAEPRERFNAITAEVSLGTGLVDRYPHGLSLGNGNASTLRPIAAHPSLVLDELTSALDVSLRSLIILLLEALQKRLGLACEQLIATADARFDEPCHAISRT